MQTINNIVCAQLRTVMIHQTWNLREFTNRHIIHYGKVVWHTVTSFKNIFKYAIRNTVQIIVIFKETKQIEFIRRK